MYNQTHLTHDAAVVEFDDSASGITTDDGEVQFAWDDVERVSVDNPPHAHAFDSKEFYRLPATVARPIRQPYQFADETVWLKKPRAELKDAAWSLDNAPWTMGHPESGMVEDVADVRGFWSNPRYIDSLDDLDADLHVPVGDTEAKEFIEDNTDVSVGFHNRIARVDAYDGIVGGSDDDEADIDGYQTDMLFDHCASVGIGRCPASKGCGIDAMHHGHIEVRDAEHGDMGVGSWVSWGSRGGTAYGKIDEIVREGCTTRGKGDREVCADDDDPAVVVEVYDDDTGESQNEMVRHKMSTLNAWSGPETDAFKRTTVTTHTHDEADDTSMNQTTDQPQGIYEADGMWFAVGPEEHPDDSTEWPGDAKYPVDNCSDVTDAWNLRGTGDISIERSTLEDRIKRVAESKGCELPDTADMDARNEAARVAQSAKRYSVCGSRKHVMEDGDCGCHSSDDDDDTHTKTNTTMEFEFDDLSTDAALAKVSANHDGVAERLEALADAEKTAEAARDVVDECDVDSIDDLADTVAMLQEQNDKLEDKIEELERPQMEDDAEYIAARTDRFGDDAEAVIDNLDADADAVSEKRELVEELTDEYDDVTANADDGTAEEETSSDGPRGYAKTPW